MSTDDCSTHVRRNHAGLLVRSLYIDLLWLAFIMLPLSYQVCMADTVKESLTRKA